MPRVAQEPQFFRSLQVRDVIQVGVMASVLADLDAVLEGKAALLARLVGADAIPLTAAWGRRTIAVAYGQVIGAYSRHFVGVGGRVSVLVKPRELALTRRVAVIDGSASA